MDPEEQRENGCIYYLTATAAVIVGLTVILLGFVPFLAPPLTKNPGHWEWRFGGLLLNFAMAGGLFYLSYRLVGPRKP